MPAAGRTRTARPRALHRRAIVGAVRSRRQLPRVPEAARRAQRSRVRAGRTPARGDRRRAGHRLGVLARASCRRRGTAAHHTLREQRAGRHAGAGRPRPRLPPTGRQTRAARQARPLRRDPRRRSRRHGRRPARLRPVPRPRCGDQGDRPEARAQRGRPPAILPRGPRGRRRHPRQHRRGPPGERGRAVRAAVPRHATRERRVARTAHPPRREVDRGRSRAARDAGRRRAGGGARRRADPPRHQARRTSCWKRRPTA